MKPENQKFPAAVNLQCRNMKKLLFRSTVCCRCAAVGTY